MSDRLTVLTSKSVFTGTEDQPFEGFVAVRGNRIEAVGSAGEADSFLAQADEVIDCGDRTVMPGLVDVHTFYTAGRCGAWEPTYPKPLTSTKW